MALKKARADKPKSDKPTTPNLSVKVAGTDVIFEIDHVDHDITTTTTLTHEQAAMLRDKLISAFRQLAKSYHINTPKTKSYLVKRPKDSPVMILK